MEICFERVTHLQHQSQAPCGHARGAPCGKGSGPNTAELLVRHLLFTVRDRRSTPKQTDLPHAHDLSEVPLV